MKTKLQLLIAVRLLLGFIILHSSFCLSALGQTTAFTYQGQLNAGGNPASGTYGLTFSLYYTNASGVAVAGPVTNSATLVTNGLFTTAIDFGSTVFNGTNCWLEIGVRTNGSATAFSILTPRQPITPTPYAIFAATATLASNVSGLVSAGQLSGMIASSNLPVNLNFAGTVSAGAVNATNLTVNGNLFLPAGTTSTGIIYSGTNTLIADFGGGNFFAGSGAGNLAMTGINGGLISGNTAVGNGTLKADTVGYYETALGYEALSNNINGANNTAVGALALQSNISGSQNTAVGAQALQSNNAGANTAMGYQALFVNASGGNNTAVGNAALDNNVGGSQNTAVGSSALVNNVNGANNTAIGYGAGSNDKGSDNTAVGFEALSSVSPGTGSADTAIGESALQENTTGVFNTAVGNSSLVQNSSGNFNSAYGMLALGGNTTGNFNTAAGYQALYSSAGDNNIALGYQAGFNVIGANNIDIGNSGVSTDINVIRIGSSQSQTFIAGAIIGNGSGLTGLQATQLVGTILSPQIGGLYGGAVNFTNSANVFAGYFYGNGSGLYSVPASAVSGTLPATQLSGTISSAQISGTYGSAVSFTGGGNNFNGSFNGNGAGLTNLNGTQITSGTIADARLSTNVALLNANQTFTGTNTFTGTSIFVGTNLNGLNASELSGTVASAQISGSYNNAVSFTNGGNIFSGKFTGNGAGLTNLSVTVTNLPAGILTNNSSSVVLNGTFSGNGTGLTNLNASQLSSGVISYAVLPGFQGNFATISGGSQNFGGGFASTVAGGQLNATIYDFGSIGGGYANQDYGYYATIGGGQSNSISGDKATIGGGYHNTAAYLSTVGGGANNNAGIAATVGGGAGNNAGAPSSTVCGGTNNTASALSSTVAGGANNQSLGQYSATVGGNDNIATGDFTFAGGNHARAPYQGDFVWADDNGGNFAATANNQFFVRAGGGVFFYSGSGSTGVQLASGSGSWSSLSDRNAKENFQTVDAQTVLTAVATMPMTTWNYKTQAKSIRHVGPMAQDFAAAFNVGENNTTISTVDEGGVALAAIQGLNQKLEAEKAENAKLKSRLEALEQLVTEKLGGAK